jgi:hypothetical protein
VTIFGAVARAAARRGWVGYAEEPAGLPKAVGLTGTFVNIEAIQ